MKIWKLFALVIMTAGVLSACTHRPLREQEPPAGEALEETAEALTGEVDSESNERASILPDMPTQYRADLEDVTSGEILFGGISTLGDADGLAGAAFSQDSYDMIAIITGLPEPEEGAFYEGWIVRSSPRSVLSTGRLEAYEESWVNEFSSDEDLTDHTRYVLTLEPDDSDPAPAEHVVEGTFTQQK